jgi:hypothetical protein
MGNAGTWAQRPTISGSRWMGAPPRGRWPSGLRTSDGVSQVYSDLTGRSCCVLGEGHQAAPALPRCSGSCDTKRLARRPVAATLDAALLERLLAQAPTISPSISENAGLASGADSPVTRLRTPSAGPVRQSAFTERLPPEARRTRCLTE